MKLKFTDRLASNFNKFCPHDLAPELSYLADDLLRIAKQNILRT